MSAMIAPRCAVGEEVTPRRVQRNHPGHKPYRLPNLPTVRACPEAYRKRWRLENVFQTLTEALVCEINTLAYPKAALFGFSVALVAYNVLATVRAALRSEHGREAVEAQVSNYHLANEVATTYEGMMIALPPSERPPLGRLSLTEWAEFLREAASQPWLAKHPRRV